MLARVIDYTIDDGRGSVTEYRLLTTLLDPEEAPAVELAAGDLATVRREDVTMTEARQAAA